jgi:hypothetical protein
MLTSLILRFGREKEDTGWGNIHSWFQLASARQLGSESVSIAIVSSDRSARVFN